MKNNYDLVKDFRLFSVSAYSWNYFFRRKQKFSRMSDEGKNEMKKSIQSGMTALLLSIGLFTLAPVRAIEGLKIAIIGNNAFLTWPSIATETYIVQYRPDFLTPWSCLTNSLPANQSGNTTTFIHYNGVTYPGAAQGVGGGSGGPPPLSQAQIAPGSINQPLPVGIKPGKNPPKDPSLPPLPPSPPGMIFPPGSSGFATIPSSGSGLLMTASTSGGTNIATTSGFYEVVRQGVHIVGITNGMTLSGINYFPVEAGNSGGNLTLITVALNGSGYDGLGPIAPPFNQPFPYFVFDTTTVSNGAYTIQANGTWLVATNQYADPADTTVSIASDQFTVNTAQEITFENWMPTFGQDFDSLLVQATSAHQNINWWVDAFDSTNGFVVDFHGASTNGQIAVQWDLTDFNGTPHTNDQFFNFVISTQWLPGAVQSVPTKSGTQHSPFHILAGEGGNSAQAQAPPTFKDNDIWTAPGQWVVANQQAWNALTGHQSIDTAVDSWLTPIRGRGYTVYPTRQDGDNNQAYRIRFDTSVPQSTIDQDWLLMKASISDRIVNCRNLIYFGHGGDDRLGFNLGGTNSYNDTDIAFDLKIQPANNLNRHAYRFVYLEGCNTANGDLPQTFGIPKKEGMHITDFVFSGSRPRAFVGWTTSPWIGAPHVILFPQLYFMQHVAFFWGTQGLTLADSIGRAAIQADTQISVKDLKIYGTGEIKFDTANGPSPRH